jgi:transposase
MSVLMNLWELKTNQEPRLEPILIMSARERDRLTILTQVCEENLTVSEAAEILSISERQAYRILQRFRDEGTKGLLHRLRGHPSNRGYGEEVRQRVLQLYWQDYRDYGPTLFSEKLAEHHRLQVNHETVRRWLIANGGSNVQRKKRPHRKRRERRAAIGELVQFDGSEHDWFEGRGPVCSLLHAIDDASSRTFLHFAPSEDTSNALVALRGYCERYGIPRALYTDYDSVYYADKSLTDVGRAMQTLGVEIIYANSPQAKGRVERGNRTHQDRLVKELRERGIFTIAEANRFLAAEYLDKHNQHFAVTENLADIHRSIEGYNFDNIFCFQTERQVRNDYTISLGGQYIQLLRGAEPLPLPRHSVTVRRYLDDTLHIFWKDIELSFEILDHKPEPKSRTIFHPAAAHPWRRSLIGKARYA